MDGPLEEIHVPLSSVCRLLVPRMALTAARAIFRNSRVFVQLQPQVHRTANFTMAATQTTVQQSPRCVLVPFMRMHARPQLLGSGADSLTELFSRLVQ